MTTPTILSTSAITSPAFSTPRNTFVLNGQNNSFSSIRIEDPKKASSSPNSQSNLQPDVCLKTMVSKIPEISKYFKIVDKIGEGTFSKVYKARLRRPYRQNVQNNISDGSDLSDDSNSDSSENSSTTDCYALKYLIPIVKPSRIAKELRFLRDLRGQMNVIPVKACFFSSGHTVLVMPIIEHDKFLDYFQLMDNDELREYIRNLLIALERIHLQGIIHRDIKPANFLYNRAEQKYALVDFGLSQSQKELDHAMNYIKHQVTSKNNVPKVDIKPSSSSSKVRANLQFRFGNKMNSISTISGSMVNTISALINNNNSLKQIKRSHEESENMVSKKPRTEQSPLFSTKNSVFISPMTPSNIKSIPDTPIKMNRTPLADCDGNLPQPQPFFPSNVSLPKSFNFTTPTKPENDLGPHLTANKTPVKSAQPNICIPETPPKTVQKTLFLSAQKKQPGNDTSPISIQMTQPTTKASNISQKENIIGHSYSTPKTRTLTTMQQYTKRFQSKKILQPELSNINSAISSNASNKTSSTNGIDSSQPCECVENAHICYGCLSKQELHVPRAGTPGFRAPEILLRSQNQSTKIDIWSTGVIFASLLTGRYPFFRCVDDMSCISEIITILGSTKMKRAANALGKTLVISQKQPPIDLKLVCTELRKSLEQNQSEVFQGLCPPDSAYDLLAHLLDPNPFTRFSASEALSHSFFT